MVVVSARDMVVLLLIPRMVVNEAVVVFMQMFMKVVMLNLSMAVLMRVQVVM